MPYVKIPNGVLDGVGGLTVSTWVNWDGKNTATASPWAWILGGDRLPNNNYGVFWSPSEGSRLTAAANDGPEYKENAAGALPANRWMQLTVVEDGSTLVMYVNGVRTDSRPAPIDFTKLYSATSTFSGLIGRTQWSSPYATFFGGHCFVRNIGHTLSCLLGLLITELRNPRLQTRDVAAQLAQPRRLLELGAGLLQAQIEHFLAQIPALGREFRRR